MRTSLLILEISCVVLFEACGSITGGGACRLIRVPAIAVSIVDAKTGAPAGSSTTIVATRRGGAADTIVTGNSPVVSSQDWDVGFDAGVYDVAVSKTGYRTWSDSGVVVQRSSDDPCRLETVRLVVELQPTP